MYQCCTNMVVPERAIAGSNDNSASTSSSSSWYQQVLLPLLVLSLLLPLASSTRTTSTSSRRKFWIQTHKCSLHGWLPLFRISDVWSQRTHHNVHLRCAFWSNCSITFEKLIHPRSCAPQLSIMQHAASELACTWLQRTINANLHCAGSQIFNNISWHQPRSESPRQPQSRSMICMICHRSCPLKFVCRASNFF